MFYLVDENHKTITGEVVTLKNVLYFKFDRANFEGKATKDHVKRFPVEYEAFRKLNPDFVLPASFSDEVIGAASVSAVVAPAVVEEAPAEVAPASVKGKLSLAKKEVPAE